MFGTPTLPCLVSHAWYLVHCLPASQTSSDSAPHIARLNKRADGYELLPDKPRPGAWAVDMKKRQEEFEAEAEKALMETYNALYKLQDCIAPVCPTCCKRAMIRFLQLHCMCPSEAAGTASPATQPGPRQHLLLPTAATCRAGQVGDLCGQAAAAAVLPAWPALAADGLLGPARGAGAGPGHLHQAHCPAAVDRAPVLPGGLRRGAAPAPGCSRAAVPAGLCPLPAEGVHAGRLMLVFWAVGLPLRVAAGPSHTQHCCRQGGSCCIFTFLCSFRGRRPCAERHCLRRT